MATITITLRDKKDGTVGCIVDLKPALKRGKKQTPAQNMLAACLEAMSNASSNTEVLEVDGDDE